jgi:lysozyme
MTTSPNGRKLIESFEGLRTSAYLPTPHDVPTIGYGHTDGVKMGDTCTQEQADAFLEEDLRAAELAIECMVAVPLNQNQFDALVSFVFNVGAHAFETSTLLRLLNEGDYAGAANQFLVWRKQNGVTLPGLVARRTKERALFLF